MRLIPIVTATAAAALTLAACAPAGYYDSNGAYRSYGASDSFRTNTPRDNAPPPGGYAAQPAASYTQPTPGGYAAAPAGGYVQPAPAYATGDHYYDNSNYAPPAPTTTVIYDRAGYYDYNGYYISSENGPEIPGRYFPPHGMCRVWFTDRPVSQEPPVESCDGIRARVPQGAYVVYGG